MLDTSHPEIKFAIEAVRLAGELASYLQRIKTPNPLHKNDASPVTVADFSVQALVGGLLQKSFSADTLVAEENSSLLRSEDNQELLASIVQIVHPFFDGADSSKICEWIDRGTGNPCRRFWTLDPIDGTKGFLRGGQYVIALALIENAEVKLGVLGCPNLNTEAIPNIGGEGMIMAAQKGGGAWYTSLKKPDGFQRLQVSGCQDIKRARPIQTFEARHTDAGLMKKIVAGLGLQIPPIVMDSQAKHGVLARGAGDLLFYLNTPENLDSPIKIWDQAAGVLMVEEAGGKVTDLKGKKLDFGRGNTLSANQGVLLTNGHLHEPALRMLQEVLK